MSIPAWFDPKAYFNNKLAATPGYNDLTLTAAFKAAGFEGDEGLWAHYQAHGASEGISPNAYFNVQQYLFAKAREYFKSDTVTQTQADFLFQLIEQAGMTPWEHYRQHGWTEGLNPSNGFDTQKYLEAKLAEVIRTDPNPDANWDMAKLIETFKAANIDPLTHYLEHGINEGLGNSFLNQGSTGQNYPLTTGEDTIVSTNGNDYFYAKLDALNTDDEIYDIGGYDTLKAIVGKSSDGMAIQPTIVNVEKIIFQAQAQVGGGGNNAVSGTDNIVAIDAGKIQGMEILQNLDSRAALVVEDVQTPSVDMTISWVNANPGLNMDFEVYFAELASEGASNTGSLNIQLMDVVAAGTAATADSPLLSQPWDIFTFTWTDINGNTQPVRLELDRAKVTGVNANYDTLLEAFQEAIAVWNAQYPALSLSAKAGGDFPALTMVDGKEYSATGTNIVISSSSGELTPNTWSTSTGETDTTSGIVSNATPLPGGTCPLIMTNIHLDNVGEVKWVDDSACIPDNAIFGSEAGDMIVGAMGDKGGIERFNVTVESGSWLSSLASTNNTLRMIQVQEGSKGELFIGEQIALDNLNGDRIDNLWGPASWNARALLLSTDGVVDVKHFDASKLDGNANIGASITSASDAKYMAEIDGVNTTAVGEYAPDGPFQYTFGNGADILNMTVNSGVAADNDFVLNISMGGGNDLVNYSYSGALTEEQLINMRTKLLQLDNAQLATSTAMTDHVNINTGAGNDTVWTWGDGVVNVNAGADNDAVYVGQNADDQNAVFIVNGTGTIYVDAVDGAQPLGNNVTGTVAVINQTGLTAENTVYVKVSFGDVESELIAIGTVPAGESSLSFNAADINRLIVKAIEDNTYLNNLFAAKEGSGYSLLIEALFNHDFSGGGEPTITFWQGASETTVAAVIGTTGNGALNGAYGTTNTAILGTADGALTVDSSAVVDPATGIVEFEASAANVLEVAVGATVALEVNGVKYFYTNTTAAALADDAAFATAIAGAVDADGNKLGDSYIVRDNAGGTATDGIFEVAGKSGPMYSVILHTVAAGTGILADGAHRADGSDNVGTVSYNVVEGGLGNDTLVLNTASTITGAGGVPFIDVLKITGAFGDDVVVNFDTGIDKIDFNSLFASNVTLAGAQGFAALGGLATDSLETRIAAAVTATFGAVGKYAGYVTGPDGEYIFFQVDNDATAGVVAGEVTVLGTIVMADGGTLAAGATDIAAII